MGVGKMIRLRSLKGAIAWDYIAIVLIALIVIIVFTILSGEIRSGIINYLKEIFKGSF